MANGAKAGIAIKISQEEKLQEKMNERSALLGLDKYTFSYNMDNGFKFKKDDEELKKSITPEEKNKLSSIDEEIRNIRNNLQQIKGVYPWAFAPHFNKKIKGISAEQITTSDIEGALEVQLRENAKRIRNQLADYKRASLCLNSSGEGECDDLDQVLANTPKISHLPTNTNEVGLENKKRNVFVNAHFGNVECLQGVEAQRSIASEAINGFIVDSAITISTAGLGSIAAGAKATATVGKTAMSAAKSASLASKARKAQLARAALIGADVYYAKADLDEIESSCFSKKLKLSGFNSNETSDVAKHGPQCPQKLNDKNIDSASKNIGPQSVIESQSCIMSVIIGSSNLIPYLGPQLVKSLGLAKNKTTEILKKLSPATSKVADTKIGRKVASVTVAVTNTTKTAVKKTSAVIDSAKKSTVGKGVSKIKKKVGAVLAYDLTSGTKDSITRIRKKRAIAKNPELYNKNYRVTKIDGKDAIVEIIDSNPTSNFLFARDKSGRKIRVERKKLKLLDPELHYNAKLNDAQRSREIAIELGLNPEIPEVKELIDSLVSVHGSVDKNIYEHTTGELKKKFALAKSLGVENDDIKKLIRKGLLGKIEFSDAVKKSSNILVNGKQLNAKEAIDFKDDLLKNSPIGLGEKGLDSIHDSWKKNTSKSNVFESTGKTYPGATSDEKIYNYLVDKSTETKDFKNALKKNPDLTPQEFLKDQKWEHRYQNTYKVGSNGEILEDIHKLPFDQLSTNSQISSIQKANFLSESLGVNTQVVKQSSAEEIILTSINDSNVQYAKSYPEHGAAQNFTDLPPSRQEELLYNMEVLVSESNIETGLKKKLQKKIVQMAKRNKVEKLKKLTLTSNGKSYNIEVGPKSDIEFIKKAFLEGGSPEIVKKLNKLNLEGADLNNKISEIHRKLQKYPNDPALLAEAEKLTTRIVNVYDELGELNTFVELSSLIENGSIKSLKTVDTDLINSHSSIKGGVSPYSEGRKAFEIEVSDSWKELCKTGVAFTPGGQFFTMCGKGRYTSSVKTEYNSALRSGDSQIFVKMKSFDEGEVLVLGGIGPQLDKYGQTVEIDQSWRPRGAGGGVQYYRPDSRGTSNLRTDNRNLNQDDIERWVYGLNSRNHLDSQVQIRTYMDNIKSANKTASKEAIEALSSYHKKLERKFSNKITKNEIDNYKNKFQRYESNQSKKLTNAEVEQIIKNERRVLLDEASEAVSETISRKIPYSSRAKKGKYGLGEIRYSSEEKLKKLKSESLKDVDNVFEQLQIAHEIDIRLGHTKGTTTKSQNELISKAQKLNTELTGYIDNRRNKFSPEQIEAGKAKAKIEAAKLKEDFESIEFSVDQLYDKKYIQESIDALN